MNDMIKSCVYKTQKGTTVTDSVKVAMVFGKQHKNVLKSIRNLVTCNADLGQLFHETTYRDSQGKLQPKFVITRRGFSLMVRNGLSSRQLALRDAIARALEEEDGQAVPLPSVESTPVGTPDIERVFTINANEIGHCIDARQLHSFLGVQRDFSTWFNYRIEQYGLVEGQDYTAISDHKSVESLSQPHRIDYAITIDTAKELAMVEGNERGKIARRYFIEVEKRYRAMATPAVPQTFAQALRLAAEQAETIERQQRQLAEQAPKVAFATAIINSPSSCGIDELAKILRQNGIDMGEIRLFQWLRKNEYLCNVGTARNQPTQKALDLGLFELRPHTWTNPKTDKVMTTTRTMVTGKGKEYFINKFLFRQQKGE